MTALPKTLARWEAELAWLEPSLLSTLGAMIPRIALAVGPLARSREPTGEPDGYGRIARRGPFDRMLASQWALLDEVPEEFLRRAFSNELLFHELARAEPRGSQRSIALFDAGPASLGAPRIAHLAILVVLARRAAEAAVPFSWGTLREPMPRAFVGEASVRALLASRTPFSATEASLDAWSEHLWARGASTVKSPASSARGDEDVWVIGDRGTLEAARARWGARVALACVEEPLTLHSTELALTVTRAPHAPRVVALPLPEPQDRVRLVRDPFRAPPPAAPSRSAPPEDRAPRAALDVELARGTDIVFSRDGRKVIARTARGGVVAVTLPDVGHPGRVLTRPVGEREHLVAAGTSGRRLVLVTELGEASPLRATELLGGARDLDMVELRRAPGRHGVGDREIRPLYVGTLSQASRPLDIAVHTRRELLVWSAVRESARVYPASLVVPVRSGSQGLVLAHRVGERGSETTPLDELMSRPDVQGVQHAPAVAIHLVAQLARCLDARRGARPHGGVRPALVSVDGSGRVAVAEPEPSADVGSGPVGLDARLAYVSPEQLLGTPVDERTDVYALGLLLHELLAGAHPAPGGTSFERIDAVRRGHLADLATQRPGIAPELHAIVRTATARDIRERFAAVGVLRDALERYRASLHVEVTEDDLVDAFRLDEIPTRHLAPATSWELVALRDAGSSPVPIAHTIPGGAQLRVGGTAGGLGLLVAVEPGRARIIAPMGTPGELELATDPGLEVIGAGGIDRIAVRRGDVIEIRDRSGRRGELELPGLARVVMSPGWPHAAAVLTSGAVHVVSLSECRTLLVIGGRA